MNKLMLLGLVLGTLAVSTGCSSNFGNTPDQVGTYVVVGGAATVLDAVTDTSTPGYAGGPPTLRQVPREAPGEMTNRIIRNAWYERKQINDDIYSVLLMDPPSHLSKWNLR